MSEPLRIAWIGGPSNGGGVGGFCRQLLTGLLEEGHDVTVLAGNALDSFHDVMGPIGREAKLIAHPPKWEWNRWYSRHPLGVFLSSFWARRRAYSQVVQSLLAEQRRRPFDVVVQFSQTELFEMRKHLHELPPFLLFPCVHAAGELKWHRQESQMALRTESRLRHYVVRANLMQRARLQKQCYHAVHGVIGMSQRFNELVRQDYGIEPQRQAVVYQPIDAVEPHSDSRANRGEGRRRLLYVGRIAVRKGVEMLVELSHRLDDVADRLHLEIVGGGSFWSDYTSVLDALNTRTATYHGPKPHADVVRLMAESDALLVPSHYEPGGIVVAEALSHGCLIVASNEVGSAEPVPETVCRRFPRGDIQSLESSVRELVGEIEAGTAPTAGEAMQSAIECFDPAATRATLVCILQTRVAQGKAIGDAPTATVAATL